MQDLEANEFAGRLILPASMLYSCIYQSIDAVAKPDWKSDIWSSTAYSLRESYSTRYRFYLTFI